MSSEHAAVQSSWTGAGSFAFAAGHHERELVADGVVGELGVGNDHELREPLDDPKGVGQLGVVTGALATCRAELGQNRPHRR